MNADNIFPNQIPLPRLCRKENENVSWTFLFKALNWEINDISSLTLYWYLIAVMEATDNLDNS